MADETVLLADDDAGIRLVVSQTLSAEGYSVRATTNPTALMRWVKNGDGDVLVTDVYMGEDCIFDFLPEIRLQRPDLPVIVISGQSTLLTATSATDGGAFEYLPKPFDIDRLAGTVKKALSKKPVGSAIRSKDRQAERDANLPLIGRSPAMQDVFRIISRVKNTELTVLIEGESGTGKELAARAIHSMGRRSSGEFVAVNLAALPRERIEAELFGHMGPDGQLVPGKAARADTGTLYLDEIGDLPLEAQTRLLRFLQNGEYTPVGSSDACQSNARVIASTKENLPSKIEKGLFREDLFYRLNVVTVAMPPLRSRTVDIPELARAFLVRSHQDGLPKKALSDKAIARLSSYQWPGNVRELQNLIQRLSVLSPEQEISGQLVEAELREAVRLPQDNDTDFEGELTRLLERHLSPMLRQAADTLALQSKNSDPEDGTDLDDKTREAGQIYQLAIEALERPLIRLAIEATNGSKIKAATILGLNRNTLRSKINSLEIASD